MWDEVPLEDAVPQVRQILVQTLAGKLQWQQSGPPGTFVAERSRVAATLDRTPDATRRRKFIRLRFSPRGQTDFKTGVTQRSFEGEPLPAELDLESYLSRLYQEVTMKCGEAPTLIDDFIEDD